MSPEKREERCPAGRAAHPTREENVRGFPTPPAHKGVAFTGECGLFDRKNTPFTAETLPGRLERPMLNAPWSYRVRSDFSQRSRSDGPVATTVYAPRCVHTSTGAS